MLIQQFRGKSVLAEKITPGKRIHSPVVIPLFLRGA